MKLSCGRRARANEHDADRGEADEGGGFASVTFKVLSQSTAVADPGDVRKNSYNGQGWASPSLSDSVFAVRGGACSNILLPMFPFRKQGLWKRTVPALLRSLSQPTRRVRRIPISTPDHPRSVFWRRAKPHVDGFVPHIVLAGADACRAISCGGFDEGLNDGPAGSVSKC
jgi:hypothetical protein